MAKIIINADDFGLSRGQNYAIVDAHELGVLLSTTLMVNMEATAHAVELMKSYPSLAVGLHLNLGIGRPLSGGKSLVDESGTLIKPKVRGMNDSYVQEEVYQELQAQYKRFVELTGKKPSHLDSHLFTTDLYGSVTEAAKQLASEYGIPLRNHKMEGFQQVFFLWGEVLGIPLGAYKGLQFLYDYKKVLQEHDYIEIMTHPGYLDPFILDNSSLQEPRCFDYADLVSTELRVFLESEGHKIITYYDVKE